MTDNTDPFGFARPEPRQKKKSDEDPENQGFRKLDRDRLQRECEAIAAEYRAPLPEGDAGLVAAVQRWRDMRSRPGLDDRGFRVTLKTEREIVKPIAGAAELWLWSVIQDTPAKGLLGVAAKLRFVIEGGCHLDLDDVDGEQLVAVIEREAAK